MAITARRLFEPWKIVQAGVVAGLVFAIFEMIAAALLMGPQAFFGPLRMIGAIALGPAALEAGYPLLTAALAGMVVHLVLSIAFAFVFAGVMRAYTGPRAYVLAGTVFGTALWLVNFYVIAPLAGWTWFPQQTNALVQFVAHAFFFGALLGALLD